MDYVIQTDGSGKGDFIALFPNGKAYFGYEEVDPLSHDLLFERFLNPLLENHRPEISLDFSMERHNEVIDYVTRC